MFVGEKWVLYYGSEKFLMVYEHNTNVPFAKPGLEFNESGAAYKVIQSKKPIHIELPAALYGVSLKVSCFPVLTIRSRTRLWELMGWQ